MATVIPQQKRVGMVSLGCPKALVDSERILTRLRADGYAMSPDYAGADVVLVNTCGFLDSAKQESLEAIGSAMAEIQKINGEYTPKLTGADGPTKAEVQKEMIGKMGAAVQASGLSPDKYNEMSAAVQKDNALRQRLTQVLNAEPAA